MLGVHSGLLVRLNGDGRSAFFIRWAPAAIRGRVADAVECGEVLGVGVGEGVQVFLGGGDLSVSHAVHDGLEVGAAGEQPGGVGVAQVVDPYVEVHARTRRRRVARRGCGRCSGRTLCRRVEQQVTGLETSVSDVSAELRDEFGWQAHGAGFVVLGEGLGQHSLAGGGVLDGDLDDGLLDGELAGGQVEVAGFEGDELAPAQADRQDGQALTPPVSVS